jgi:hypothetical protein
MNKFSTSRCNRKKNDKEKKVEVFYNPLPTLPAFLRPILSMDFADFEAKTL